MNGFPMQPRPSSRGCSRDYIANLPEKSKTSEQTDCYICLEKVKEGKDSCELPCKHAFDRACLEHWIKDHDSCPVCRMKLDNENGSRPEPENNANQDNASPRFSFFF